MQVFLVLKYRNNYMCKKYTCIIGIKNIRIGVVCKMRYE